MPGPGETAIGVDVGGTRIRIARITRAGDLLERIAEPVRHDRDGFAGQLSRLVHDIRRDGDAAVGIGIPGRVDALRGRVLSAGYLDIAGLDLPALVRDAAGLPAVVENDATMALVAEARRWPGGLVTMVTVGTGVGGAALVDGRPWYGGGVAGQFGHIVVSEDGPPCNCGRRGCVETFSSGTALGRLITEAGFPEGTRAEDLLAAAATSDARARAVLDRWAEPMRRAVETLVAVADPAVVLLGGGLGREMADALRGRDGGSPWFRFPVEAAALGDDAGVTGAGLRALQAVDP